MSLANISPGNQPDRVFINSDDSPEYGSYPTPTLQSQLTRIAAPFSYSGFNYALSMPALNVEGIQLASFSQTNAPGDGPCIPDYQASVIGFMYYRTPVANAGLPPYDSAGNLINGYGLNYVYFLSSTNQVTNTPNPVLTYTNRYFSSYTDFVTGLNAAATATAAGDIQFGYDATLKKIYWWGTNSLYTYMPAGSTDLPVAAYILSVAGGLNPVPYTFTLNQRVGFANESYNFIWQKPGVATAGGAAANWIYPFGYPNLVRTNTITVRTNFNPQSSINSKNQRDVLAVVQVNVPFLGVNQYQAKLNKYLVNVPPVLQNLNITFWDDQGQPYPTCNNANTNLEMLISYGGKIVS